MGSVVVQYSEAFKLKVVGELESGRLRSRREAQERYGIRGSSTVSRWVRRYGKAEIQGKVIRVETTDERDQIKALKARIKELECAVVDSKVQEALHKAYFDSFRRGCGVKDPAALKKSIASKLSGEDASTASQKDG
jgi:transposase-like protein